MNKKALEILEYNRIIEMLVNETGSELSAEMAGKLEPSADPREISENLRSTTEAVDLIVHKGPLPTAGVRDIRRPVSLARKGGTLSMKELLEVKQDLKIAERTKTFMKGDLPELPRIRALTDLLVPHEKLAGEIERCILTEDEMADNASRELSRIRRSIVLENEAVRSRLERMVSSQTNSSYLQDSIVTMRDGRYVIPVKSEHKGKFPGIVHDTSRGGGTLFIEPQVIIDMNNHLRELESQEKEEMARILAELSAGVSEAFHDLNNNQELLAELDFIMAKGKLSQRMDAEEPKLDDQHVLELKDARHPLLDPKKAVPITVSLGRDYHTLVITGPNTGGKTLTLKTMGLLSLMAQAGLRIPASSESRVPVYQYIFADIGDEQSIEQNLSTFSSHMKNIVFIVRKADDRTLVLLDELGGGTDPTEGAALAISVLEELKARGAWICATTHYNEVKKYALSADQVENASMEFDVETLSPTYRLMMGIPGKSNAFEISKKLGLSRRIIQRADELIERGDAEFEDLISEISEDRMAAARERGEAEAVNASMRQEKEQFDVEKARLEKEKEQILREAKREARMILKDARQTAREVQRDLNRIQKNRNLGERNREMARSSRKLREKEEKYAEHIVKRVNSEPVDISQLSAGDTVRVLSLNQNGTILSLPDGDGEMQVQVGILKMKVKAGDVMLLNDGSKQANRKKIVSARRSAGGSIRRKAMNVKSTLDVRGENGDDARMDVEKYLDDAYLGGLREVTLIHGRGTGVLKAEIRKDLKANKHVAAFRPGAYNEGGEGVTIVTLKRE